ncbi:MAG: ATP-dependent RNA helicase HrpA [Actinomycetota bacterium]
MTSDLAITYPAELPISERRDELLATIEANQVVVVAGETGSGKSTQLPKLCLELGRGVNAFIGHTQPRRIAARAIAERVASELDTSLGDTVGYTVRFNDRVGPDTRVKLMTDGILLAEIPRDRNLKRYDTIIIDEAHERSLNIDFILGYLKQLLPRRPDLKVIITSATIDTARFAEHFDDAPVIEVSGRTYPVEVQYRPIDGSDGREPIDVNDGITDAVSHLWRADEGDVLVFCSGEREIRDAAEAVADLKLPGAEILPLYARLSAAEQHRVFAAHDKRRVVIATNVAETSVTVPGIRSVVDVGTARISRYSHRTKVQRLPIEPVSQASADQRAGRCGRIAPGICIRLYAEDDYDARPEFTEPEIQRTNLASVILRMASLGLGRVEEFPFVDPPEHRSIRDGIDLLTELDALDPDHVATKRWLTPIGREVAKLPVDPRYGRMLVEADENSVLDEAMVIVAGLSVQDPRERPSDNQQRADESHRRFADPESDFLSYLNLWDYLATARRERSRNQFRRLCRREFLNYNRVIEWQDIHTQLRQVTRELKFRSRSGPSGRGRGRDRAGRTSGGGGSSRADRIQARYLPDRGDAVDGPDRWGGRERRDDIHRSILAGLLSHIGVKQVKDTDAKARNRQARDGNRRRPRTEFIGARNSRFAIAPGSALTRNAPEWVMAAELVETSRLWGRVAAGIQPDWVEDVAGHLASYGYGEPWWDAKRGSASVSERVTLFGLTLVANRTRQLAQVDPALARELFIHHALVEGEWDADFAFVGHNKGLIAEVQALEARNRRRDLLVEAKVIHDFYDQRLPDDIVSTAHFRRWWKKRSGEQRRRLELTTDDLLNPEADTVDDDAFPDAWLQDGLDLELAYEFDPASPLDGVSVLVPVEVLNQLDPDPFTWSVPGFRPELYSALIRSLPKVHRRLFTPITETVDRLLLTLDPTEGPLLDVLALRLGRRAGVVIDREDFDLDRVPSHLFPTFRVINADYELLAEGKDIPELRAYLEQQVRTTLSVLAAEDNDWERDGLTRWDFGTLPQMVDTGQIKAFPSLVDEGDTVAIRLHPDADEQQDAHWPGCRRLLRLNLSSPVRQVDRLLDNDTKLNLLKGHVQSKAEWYNDIISAALDDVIEGVGGPVWTEDAFERLVTAAGDQLPTLLADAADEVGRILELLGEIATKLDHLSSTSYTVSVDDVRAQLARLTYPGFVTGVGLGRLPDIARYLQAVVRRLDSLTGNPQRDLELLATCRRLDNELAELAASRPGDPGIEPIVWMLEELRVGLFAQSLGTKERISPKRVRRALNELRSSPAP